MIGETRHERRVRLRMQRIATVSKLLEDIENLQKVKNKGDAI